MITIAGTLLMGMLAGLWHALEIDHVAAVSSLVSAKSSRHAMVQHGIVWGIGHASTLFVVTAFIIMTNWVIRESASLWLEFAVGVMLLGLGLHVLWRLWTNKLHMHLHQHEASVPHLHFHSHLDDSSPHSVSLHHHAHKRFPMRALAVGVMHGMAGSAALVVLTAISTGSLVGTLAYVAVFGIGSILGMALLSAVLAVPLSWTAKYLLVGNRIIQLTIGMVTISVGLMLVYTTKLHLIF